MPLKPWEMLHLKLLTLCLQMKGFILLLLVIYSSLRSSFLNAYQHLMKMAKGFFKGTIASSPTACALLTAKQIVAPFNSLMGNEEESIDDRA